MWCPSCRSEYREGVWICSDCREPLVAEEPREPVVERSRATGTSRVPATPEMRTTMLGRFNPLEIPIVLDMLEEHGVFAMTKLPYDEPNRSEYTFIQTSTGSDEVIVDASKLEKAQALVRDELPRIRSAMEAALDEEPFEQA